jgi:hypothetical protein
VHKEKIIRSVGILRRIPELMNILRKEGFARVHRQRKWDALNLSIRPREKPSKNGVERKECTEIDFKSILQAQGEEKYSTRKVGGSPLKDAKELGTLEVFKLSKVAKESMQNSTRGA